MISTALADREAVLLLHGLWVSGWVMEYLGRKLKGAGFAPFSLNYRSMRGGMEEHLDVVARRVESMRSKRVHLVGHSLGGVVAFDYLRRRADRRIGRAVLLGAPVKGCQAALLLARSAPGRFLLGTSLALWRAPFDCALDAHREVGAIAGTHPLGLGGTFLRLPGPSDGVVMVEETRVPGLRDHLTLPVSHSGMLLSALVARQSAAFLASGRFER